MTSLAESNARTLRAIDTLAPYFQKRVRGWAMEMVNSKIPPLIYCGRRTMEEQTALFAIGRTSPGKVVTKARAGESFHNHGLAFDWVPIKISTKNPDLYVADWNDETAFRLGEHVGQSFELAAISWETGHLQASEYASWRDILHNKVEQRLAVFAKPTVTRRVKTRKP